MTMTTRPNSRTITCPNGAKVRTARSRRFVAVRYGTLNRGKRFAWVLSGSDNLPVLKRRAARWDDGGGSTVFFFDLLLGEVV